MTAVEKAVSPAAAVEEMASRVDQADQVQWSKHEGYSDDSV